MAARSFVLDQNFPEMVLKVRLPEADLRALRSVDPWLTSEVEDWAILAALHQARPSIDGFITCDERMLSVAKVLAVFKQTNLSLVVCAGVGHDPIAATGLLLLHLPAIARSSAGHPQLYVLRTAKKGADDVERWVERLARGKSGKPDLRKYQLDQKQLTEPLKDWYSLQALPMPGDKDREG